MADRKPDKRLRKGEQSPKWLGDKAKPEAGWARAHYLYSLRDSVCEICGTKAQLERHHKDNNPLNNAPENVQIVCRYHHMIHKPPRSCSNCGKFVQQPRKGRCTACASYWRRNRVERPERYW